MLDAALLRREGPLVIAHVNRLVKDLDLAEDIFQQTLVASLEAWRANGAPKNPGAFLMTAAHHRAIDTLRRGHKVEQWNEQMGREGEQHLDAIDEGDVYPDERLRMVFTCCHPELQLEAQVALTLRLVCGLTTPEVARAFLVPEPTIQQRIVRAKRVIKDSALPYEVPEPEQMPGRLRAVLQVLQLVFNEGYSATSGDALIRKDLIDEGLRLAGLVVDALPEEPEARGLLSLMQLHAARGPAREGPGGELVLLEQQDRSKWDAALIQEGLDHLRIAAAAGAPGVFQIQAHIASTHATAATWEATDWKRIGHLYQALEIASPSPVFTLNRSVAVAMSEGPAAGLALLDALVRENDALKGYYLLPATRADLLRRLALFPAAIVEYRRAIELTGNAQERKYLEKRLAECLSIAPGIDRRS